MVSTKGKIQRVLGLKPGDLNEWERSFVHTLRLKAEENDYALTEKQLDALDRIFRKHFAG